MRPTQWRFALPLQDQADRQGNNDDNHKTDHDAADEIGAVMNHRHKDDLLLRHPQNA